MAIVPDGKPSQTEWRVLERLSGATYLDVHLLTGRTHQIRVHMLHLGHPLLGDPIYANPKRQKAHPGRLMLHAWRLAFNHPKDGHRVAVEAPIPPEYAPWLTGAELPAPAE
ncbi:MAG: RluA family pseudouridine synthase, partial [Akkermansia sp.]